VGAVELSTQKQSGQESRPTTVTPPCQESRNQDRELPKGSRRDKTAGNRGGVLGNREDIAHRLRCKAPRTTAVWKETLRELESCKKFVKKGRTGQFGVDNKNQFEELQSMLDPNVLLGLYCMWHYRERDCVLHFNPSRCLFSGAWRWFFSVLYSFSFSGTSFLTRQR